MGHIQIGKANMAILNGTEDLSLWDEEELLRGQRKSRNGKFHGRPPTVVPKAVHDELVRRQMEQAVIEMRESLVPAVKLLRQVVEDEEADYGYRIRAAQLIIERLMGKTPERVQLSVAPPWAVALETMIETARPQLMQAEVIEADGWDEEDG